MVFLRLIALLYPTSDLNHIITTPGLILITMVLSKVFVFLLYFFVLRVFFVGLCKTLFQNTNVFVPISIVSRIVYLEKKEK